MGTAISDSDIVATSKVFQRGKTVIPSEVRMLLSIDDGGKIVWRYNRLNGIIYIKIGEDKVRYTVSGKRT